MYKIPEDFDGAYLVNAKIESICFGLYQVNLYLTGGAWIQIEGPFEHSRKGRSVQVVEGYPITKTTLLGLIGISIVKFGIADDSSLLLEMTNGDTLMISSRNGMYEAYRLFDGKREIVV